MVFADEVPGDVFDLVNYLQQQKPELGERFLVALYESFNQILDMPGIGSLKPLRNKKFAGLRSWSVVDFPNHLILYMWADNTVRILAVSHGARNLVKLLRNR